MDLIRAWKDEEYRLSLSEAERASLPENPAGSLELTDAEMELAAGGGGPILVGRCFFSVFYCGGSCFITIVICGNTIGHCAHTL